MITKTDLTIRHQLIKSVELPNAATVLSPALTKPTDWFGSFILANFKNSLRKHGFLRQPPSQLQPKMLHLPNHDFGCFKLCILINSS